MIKMLSGNEAVARGAWEAGVAVASAYPGTPSTEILENLARYPNVYAEWAPNEKVAVDVAIGAAYAGKRAMATMKHVGLNVAADSFMYAAMTGSEAGLVIVIGRRPADAFQPERAGQPHFRQVRPHPLPGTERQPGSQGHDHGGFRAERAFRHAGAAAADHAHLPFVRGSGAGRAHRAAGGRPSNTRATRPSM